MVAGFAGSFPILIVTELTEFLTVMLISTTLIPTSLLMLTLADLLAAIDGIVIKAFPFSRVTLVFETPAAVE